MDFAKYFLIVIFLFQSNINSAAMLSPSSSNSASSITDTAQEEISQIKAKMLEMGKTISILMAQSTKKDDEGGSPSSLKKEKEESKRPEALESKVAKEEPRKEIVPPVAKHIIDAPLERRFINVPVKSQMDTDGGGTLSCGYHAFNNGVNIARWLMDGSPDKDARLASSTRSGTAIGALFGTNESRWRASVINHRKSNFVKFYIYDKLLFSIVGALSLAPTTGISKALKSRTGHVHFVPFTTEQIATRYTHDDRETFINILTDVAARFETALQTGKPGRLPFGQLREIITNIILAKKTTEPERYRDLENKIEMYMPNINLISFSLTTERVSFVTGPESDLKMNDLTVFGNYAHEGSLEDIGREKRTGLYGELLDASDLFGLVNAERENKTSTSIWRDLGATRVAIINNMESFDTQLLNNEQLTAIVNDSRNVSNASVSILLINMNERHWITCVVHKQVGQKPVYYFADSLNNVVSVDNLIARRIIRAIEGETVAFEEVPSDVSLSTSISSVSTTKHKPFEKQLITAFSGEDLSQVPTIEQIFDNKVPIELTTGIRLLQAGSGVIRNGFLLNGPPGNGKTTLAFQIARLCERQCIYKNGGSFLREFQGSGSRAFEDLFEQADSYTKKHNKGIVIIIDESEGAMASQSSGKRGEEMTMLASLLAQLNLYKHNPRIVSIFATNHIQVIEKSITDRFWVLPIEAANYAIRSRIINDLLIKKNFVVRFCEVSDSGKAENDNVVRPVFLQDITIATKGFSARSIADITKGAIAAYELNVPNDMYPSRHFCISTNYTTDFGIMTGIARGIGLSLLVPFDMLGRVPGTYTKIERYLYAFYERVRIGRAITK